MALSCLLIGLKLILLPYRMTEDQLVLEALPHKGLPVSDR